MSVKEPRASSFQQQLSQQPPAAGKPPTPGTLARLGDFVDFSMQAIKGIRRIGPFAAETVRQAAIIAAGSALVIMLLTFLAGNACGLEASAITRQLGADPAGPFFASFCTTREIVPIIFGYILAAKVGCGLVAELGSMQVSEEVDALDTMAINSVVYLVSTRLVACLFVLPIMYFLALATGYIGAWYGSLIRFADVSQGLWEFGFYTALPPVDLLYSVTKGFVIAFAVLLIALYYGYRVRGGPVEVGNATARSMLVSMAVVTILNMIGTVVFWGFDPGLPIA
ncbi:MAG: ABC transporter permease [Thermoleophilaceae bacterium]|nr:ABC transporter permease [Thermoleophilaceae bacterium]